MLEENYKRISNQIKAASSENGGEGRKARLVAVSKRQPLEKIHKLYDMGVRNFGENYVQEALVKIEALSSLDVEWHFIGQIQKKKIKDIVGRFQWIHSIDRLDVAEKVAMKSKEMGLVQKVLVQVNIGNELSKQGVPPAELNIFLQAVSQLDGLDLRGLMVFPPLEKETQAQRMWLRLSQELFLTYQKKHGESFSELSKGTSSDYLLALSEGATMIRLGEILLGPRNS